MFLCLVTTERAHSQAHESLLLVALTPAKLQWVCNEAQAKAFFRRFLAILMIRQILVGSEGRPARWDCWAPRSEDTSTAGVSTVKQGRPQPRRASSHLFPRSRPPGRGDSRKGGRTPLSRRWGTWGGRKRRKSHS